MPLRFSRSGSRSRKASSRVRTASRASEQGCARPPDSIKLRYPSSPKLAALSSLVTMPYLVSSPALAHHPSAHLLIIRHPALAVLLRTAMARRGDALSSQAARQSCSCMRVCICSAGRVAHEPRRCSASRAAARLVVLSPALWCMDRLLAELELAQHAHHAAHTHSHFAPCWADLGTALGRYMHACAAGGVQNV